MSNFKESGQMLAGEISFLAFKYVYLGVRDIFQVKGAARTGRDSVLKSLASSVENFKPIAPNITPEGDLEFFLTDPEVKF